MNLADIVMVTIADYAGLVRGKGFVGSDREKRLASGIAIAPTNLMITCFGDIVHSPWGSRGELLMMPDPATRTSIHLGEGRPDEQFYLSDLVELDGTPWSCCPRSWLKRGLKALEAEFGLKLFAAFEHEFAYTGAPERLGGAYMLDMMRLQGTFGAAVVHALAENGIEPELFMPEYGPRQFEVTCRPAIGVEAADRAVRLREIVRAVARAHGHRACFAPVMKAGSVGNGVHVHYSLQDRDGRPVTHDPAMPAGVGAAAARFTAGILAALPSLCALTAPSAVSYERLQPHRWSAAFNNLADKDREAGVRIAPLARLPGSDPAKAFNLECRALDAAASPYFALGALVWAGLDGLRRDLPLPAVTDGDLSEWAAEDLAAKGLRRLPGSLSEALELYEGDARVAEWMGAEFHHAYAVHKRSELALLEGVSVEEQVRRYGEVY